MEFTTQIGTTQEQSKRLLALGLKAETADMRYQTHYFDMGGILKECTPTLEPYPPLNNDRFIPAWSLHRLLAMLTYQVIYNDTKYEPGIALDGMDYHDVCADDPVVGWSGDLYTDVIDCIEWVIGQEQFNPDYLKG
jgi:hypothetical protein